MQLYLKWTDSLGQPHRLALGGNEILIGRKSDADVQLSNLFVSRRHARLIWEGDGYSLEVNGRQVGAQRIRIGDQILIGKVPVQLGADKGQEQETVVLATDVDDLEKALHSLAPAFGSTDVYAELHKISCLLELQTGLGAHFSVDATFRQILKFALQISGAERGFEGHDSA